MKKAADLFTKETLLWHTGILEDAFFSMQRAFAIKRTVAEVTLVRLCDPLLDTSTAAILSRLSQLEEKAVTGSLMTSPVTPPSPPSSVAQSSAELSDTDTGVDIDTNEAQATAKKAGAQPQGTLPPSDDAATVASNRRVLRPLRQWTEVLERLREKDSMRMSFYKIAKAYTTEAQTYVVKFTDAFTCEMATKNGGMEALQAALSVTLGKVVRVSDIEVEVETKTHRSDDSLLDLILESVEDTN